jgi:hypothetical protein
VLQCVEDVGTLGHKPFEAPSFEMLADNAVGTLAASCAPRVAARLRGQEPRCRVLDGFEGQWPDLHSVVAGFTVWLSCHEQATD